MITRLEKLDSGEYDCLILAAAGLGRLGFGDRIHQLIPGDISLHAVGQGALGIECVEGKPEVIEAIKVLEHTPLPALPGRACFLRELEGGCQVRSASTARSRTATSPHRHGGQSRWQAPDSRSGQWCGASAESIGIELAAKLKQQGAGEILKEIFDEVRPEA
ncbi:MAG: hypothetical protein CM15mP77_3500 [Synechococcus sp.]|nr:MAG: hypothetical protein CM15mP77_3500 [Synechococcus sp.]